MLYSKLISTPLGSMIAIADSNTLRLLQFTDYKKLDAQINSLKTHTNDIVIEETTPLLSLLEQELSEYFSGSTKPFTIPIKLIGTAFQKTVWNTLLNISYGTVTTYKCMAELVKHPYALRAVGTAHGANKIAIIIPCHRVISTNGSIRGYASGPERKAWLLDFEKNHTNL